MNKSSLFAFNARKLVLAVSLVFAASVGAPTQAHTTGSTASVSGAITKSVCSQLLTPANNASIATSVQVKYESDTTHGAGLTNTDLIDSYQVTYDVYFYLGHGVDRDNWSIVASGSSSGNLWNAGPGASIFIPAGLSTSYSSYAVGTYEGQAYSFIDITSGISTGTCDLTHYHPWTQN